MLLMFKWPLAVKQFETDQNFKTVKNIEKLETVESIENV